MKHILSINVRNRPGVMSHVSGLFTRRGFNIESIAVGVTQDPDVSVITLVVKGDEKTAKQLQGQMLKLADVIDVRLLSWNQSVIREAVLVRVRCTAGNRSELFGVVEVFHGTVQEITEDSLLIDVQGNPRQINSLMTILEQYGIVEVARTGQIALPLTGE